MRFVFQNILHCVGSEINGVVEAASFGAVEAYEVTIAFFLFVLRIFERNDVNDIFFIL